MQERHIGKRSRSMGISRISREEKSPECVRLPAFIIYAHWCRGGMLIRFHPESRASTDQHPGPSSASTAARLDSKTLSHGLQLCGYALNSSRASAITLVIRVQKPKNRNIPSAIPIRRSVINSRLPLSSVRQQATANAVPVATRRSSSPRLGRESVRFAYGGCTTSGYRL